MMKYSLEGKAVRGEGGGEESSVYVKSTGETSAIRAPKNSTISPTPRTPHHCRTLQETKGAIMTKWITQQSSALICFLSSLCTGLLFIVIILLVTFTRQGVDQTEHSMEVKLRNLSLGVHSRVEGLYKHDSLMMEKLNAMEAFVKDLIKSELTSKVVKIETSMKQILSSEVTGSFMNDHQRILVALGELADEFSKGNSSADSLCETGWVHYGSSCYYLFRQIKSWLNAKENCEQRKAHLVVINSREEMTFIAEHSRSVSLWIGLSDLDGSWKWVDGTPYEKTPKFWKSGQPDDWFNPSKGEGEDCTHIVDGDKWNDIDCSLSFPYVCEKTIS